MGERANTFRIFRGAAGLARLAEDWNALVRRVDRCAFFHYHEWHASYIGTLEPDPDSLFFAVYYEGAAPAAIFPLKRVRTGAPFRLLSLPHHPRLRFWDFVVARGLDGGRVFASLLDFLAASRELAWDCLRLKGLMPDSAAIRCLGMQPKERTVIVPGGTFHTVPLVPAAKLHERLSANFRANLRKAHRRLRQAGEARIVHARAPAALAEAYEEFLEIEASGWKGRSGTALKYQPRQERFFREVVRRLGARGQAEIARLEVTGKPIAAQISVLAGDTCFMHKIAFDEAYGHLSPGHLLIEDVLTRYGDDGRFRRVNVITAMEWHRAWRPEVQELTNAYLFRPSLSGRLAATLFDARRWARGRFGTGPPGNAAPWS